MADVIAHLAEFDTRDVHLRAGYGSLFVYCRDELALAEGDAYNRIEVARAARRFPLILEMLAEGAVNVTNVRLLAPHLTPESQAPASSSPLVASGSYQVEEIAARLAPRPDVAGLRFAGSRLRPRCPRLPRFCGRVRARLGAPAAAQRLLTRRRPARGYRGPARTVPISASGHDRDGDSSTSSSSPRTCCATPSRPAPTPPSSTGPSARSSPTSPGRSSPPPTIRARRRGRPRDHVTSLRT